MIVRKNALCSRMIVIPKRFEWVDALYFYVCVCCRCIGFRFKVLQTLAVFVCSNSGVCSFFPTEVCHKCIHLRERKRDDIEIQLTEKKETKRQIYQHQQDPLYMCVCAQRNQAKIIQFIHLFSACIYGIVLLNLVAYPYPYQFQFQFQICKW